MNFDNLIELLNESIAVEEILIRQVRLLQRKVRMVGNKAYRLHLSNDTLSKGEHQKKLKAVFNAFIQEREHYLAFLRTNRTHILNSPKLLEIVKDFKKSNPIVFENDPLKDEIL